MYVALYTTFQDIEEAKKFGRIILDERLAACVNIIPNVISLYRWDEAVQEDKEVIVWIKTALVPASCPEGLPFAPCCRCAAFRLR